MNGILALAVGGILASILSSGDCACFPDRKQNCGPEAVTQGIWNTKARFFLFTRRNTKAPEMLHICRGTLPEGSELRPARDLVVIIPGFNSGMCDLTGITDIKDELLKKGDFNVLMVDSTPVYGSDFTKAINNAKKMANTVINVLHNIQRQTGVKNERIHLIGHSLGAHTAGLIGQQFKVRRITGLDPAGVTFEKSVPDDLKLSRGDADLVDILHCNGGTGLPYLGIPYQSGDADFYVNGGIEQPDCLRSAWQSLKSFHPLVAVGVATSPTICSHVQCIEYFKQSINGQPMISLECPSYKKFKNDACLQNENVSMGFDLERTFVPDTQPRKFYIHTS